MDVLTDDHEREQVVRAWWKEYWKPIALGVAIAIGGLVGYRQWQAYDLRKAQSLALELYQAQTALAAGGENSEKAALDFINGHQDLYGALLALRLAAKQGADGKYEDATVQLEFARAHGGALVEPAATLAKARLQAQAGQHDAALSTLQQISSESYQTEKLEAQGDIAMLKGDRKGARDAYKQAIDRCLSRNVPVSSLLQMKFDNVTVEGDKSAYEMTRAHNAELASRGENIN